jgi:N-carbamoyl-L-amino-acid hydrolase
MNLGLREFRIFEEWIEPQQSIDGTRVLYQTLREPEAMLARAAGR